MIKGFSKNTLLNFVSNFILIGTLQLIFFPYLSEILSDEEFGNILFILGIVNLFNSMFAASLSNLILRKGIQNTKVNNLFNWYYILSVSVVVPVFLIANVLLINENHLIVLYLIFLMLRTYGIAYYRLKLDYMRIAILSVVNASVLLILLYSLVEVISAENWFLIILIPEFIVALVIGRKIKLFSVKSIKEITSSVRSIKINKAQYLAYLMLIVFGMLEASFSYIDRFVLQNTLGSDKVAQFFISSSFSKFQPLFLNIISGVLLSYIATSHQNLWQKNQLRILALLGVLSVFLVTLFYLFNDLYLDIIYPNFKDYSDRFLFISSIVYCLFGVDIILRSFLIKMVDLKLILRKELFALLFLLLLIFIFFTKTSEIIEFLYLLLSVGIFKLSFSIYLLNKKNAKS